MGMGPHRPERRGRGIHPRLGSVRIRKVLDSRWGVFEPALCGLHPDWWADDRRANVRSLRPEGAPCIRKECDDWSAALCRSDAPNRGRASTKSLYDDPTEATDSGPQEWWSQMVKTPEPPVFSCAAAPSGTWERI